MMDNPFLYGLIDDGLYFTNAPQCRTRSEATTQWLEDNHFAEPDPFSSLGDTPGDVIHQIYHPWSDDRITNRLITAQPHGQVYKAVRIGKSNLENEKAMLKLVKASTPVPVPQVHSYNKTKEFEVLLLDHVEGETLEHAWPTLSDEERANLADQVVALVEQLRTLTSSRLQAFQLFNREPLQNGLVTVTDFNLERFRAFIDDEGSRLTTYIRDKTEQLSTQSFVLTHGDLDWSNIMVKDKKVCGLIDFEMSGFLPSYWEWLLVQKMAKYTTWFELLEERMRHWKEPGWDGMWELEELWEAFSSYSRPGLTPDARGQNQSRGWADVVCILGDDTRPPPKVKYPKSWTDHPWWLESRQLDV